MSIISTVTYILQSVLFPTYSKLSDLFGRAEVFSVCMLFYILAYIVMATANSFAALVVSSNIIIIIHYLRVLYYEISIFEYT